LNRDVEEFLASSGYAETTERTYRDVLGRFVLEFPQTDLLASNLLTFLHAQGWGNARQCMALAACRSFIAWRCGTSHPALAARLKRIRGSPQRALSHANALILLASFDRLSAIGARDLAICSLAIDAGLRAAELCRLQQADVDTSCCVLQVLVKGGQWKAGIFSEETAAHIEHWKIFRKDLKPQSFLFVAVRKCKGHGLTPEGLNTIIGTWGKRIGIKLSPHDLRRSMAIFAAENGAGDRALMDMGRWASTDMPRLYTRTFQLENCRKYLPIPGLK
jgi:integrase/recombinase XerD